MKESISSLRKGTFRKSLHLPKETIESISNSKERPDLTRNYRTRKFTRLSNQPENEKNNSPILINNNNIRNTINNKRMTLIYSSPKSSRSKSQQIIQEYTPKTDTKIKVDIPPKLNSLSVLERRHIREIADDRKLVLSKHLTLQDIETKIKSYKNKVYYDAQIREDNRLRGSFTPMSSRNPFKSSNSYSHFDIGNTLKNGKAETIMTTSPFLSTFYRMKSLSFLYNNYDNRYDIDDDDNVKKGAFEETRKLISKLNKGNTINDACGLRYIKTKFGNKYKMAGTAAIIVKKDTPKGNVVKQIYLKKDINGKSKDIKDRIKLGLMKWFWKYKGSHLETYISYYNEFEFYLNQKGGISKESFIEFLRLAHIEKDDLLIENIFLMFDHKRRGKINFKEFLTNIFVFADFPFEKKLFKIFEELHGTDLYGDDKKYIYYFDFLDILQIMLSVYEIKNLLKTFFKYLNISNVNRDTLYKKNIEKISELKTENFPLLIDDFFNFIKEDSRYYELLEIKMARYVDIPIEINDLVGEIFTDNLKIFQTLSDAKEIIAKPLLEIEEIVKIMVRKKAYRRKLEAILDEEQ